jgi:predicted DsbA family dithiol-disulfide isomerase
MILAILAVCAVAAWICGDLVRQHVDVWGAAGARGGLLSGLCHATRGIGFDCTRVGQSDLAKIVLPIPRLYGSMPAATRRIEIPVAFLGLAYFASIGVWYVFAGGPRVTGRRWHLFALLAACTGAVVSIFYLAVMTVGRAPWCVSCCAVHALNFVLIATIVQLHRGDAGRKETPLNAHSAAGDAGRTAISTIVPARAIALALALVAALFLHMRAHLIFRDQLDSLRPYRAMVDSLRADPEFLIRDYLAQPRHDMAPRPTENTDGDVPELTVFTDFQCPACYCNSLHIRRRIATAFDGRLRLRVRHFPLCRHCNPDVAVDSHRAACEAARAAEAARLVGGEKAFDGMCASLFAHRKSLDRSVYLSVARSMGLDVDRFIEAMSGDAVRRIVASDVELAREIGVTATPAMFLNGRRITDICMAPVFWEAIAARLPTGSGDGPQAPIESIAGPIPQLEN